MPGSPVPARASGAWTLGTGRSARHPASRARRSAHRPGSARSGRASAGTSAWRRARPADQARHTAGPPASVRDPANPPSGRLPSRIRGLGALRAIGQFTAVRESLRGNVIHGGGLAWRIRFGGHGLPGACAAGRVSRRGRIGSLARSGRGWLRRHGWARHHPCPTREVLGARTHCRGPAKWAATHGHRARLTGAGPAGQRPCPGTAAAPGTTAPGMFVSNSGRRWRIRPARPRAGTADPATARARSAIDDIGS